MIKKELQWGDGADIIAKIAIKHLKMSLKENMHASISEIYTAVQRHVVKNKLEIEVSSSRIITVLTAEKRSVSMIKIQDKGIFFTLTPELIPDIVREIMSQKKTGAKVYDFNLIRNAVQYNLSKKRA